ncbi:hypothetical protein [Spirosoma sordidisoli]|uniref:Uncharacterized protein n=1 Tax=Spirosoma sordidisoli TaxID=2502893 RepID=A0A4Q2UJU4_9BACT|nr:hypothetical protein [Spirosoma sordidisoli]RYC69773.1 hypothetical protein EQG79_14350 [Spirosoma sordidisoli]
MISLKLTPNEFKALILFVRGVVDIQSRLPIMDQHLSGLVLEQYLGKWRPHQLLAWGQRTAGKEFKLNLPLPVAKALWQEMQYSMLMGWQQLLLGKLDQALINYRNPLLESATYAAAVLDS